MTIVVNANYQQFESQLASIEQVFDDSEVTLQAGRNHIKSANIGDEKVVIKSFKRLGVVRGFIYRFLRKSKARRAYEYAENLLSLGFNTPFPIAYIERGSAVGVTSSFFVSSHFDHDFEIRAVLDNKVANSDQILEQFVKFSFDLHNAGVLHLDHSPGNTLVKKAKDGGYKFALIDINRMQFRPLSTRERLENLSRLSDEDDIVRKFASHYAALASLDEEICFQTIKNAATKRFKALNSRKALKKKLGLKKS